MKTENIKSLQTDLAQMGLYGGLIDGDWGSKSQTAWVEAQQMLKDCKAGNMEPPLTETILMQKGDQGEQVEHLQHALCRIGYLVKIDGDFGGGTERAVKTFQAQVGLVVDGRVGEKTLAAIEGMPFPESLTQVDIERAAYTLGVDTSSVLAVNEVETRGRGFFTNGLPAILFERHIMRRRLLAYELDPTPYIQSQPDIVNIASGGYLGGLKEYERLERAKKIHLEAARESASWGCYQIMGYHWKILGFDSVNDFVMTMRLNEGEHLKAFVKFIQFDSKLHKALKDRDWMSFALIYNGRNQKGYDKKLELAYAKHSAG